MSTSTPAHPEGDFFGLVQQYPGSSGAIRDFAAVTDDAHARCVGDGGRRPARADAVEAPGGVGCRRGGRLDAALRRSSVVRRAARGVHRGPGRARAGPARAPGWPLGRCRGAVGLPVGPPDPRAAHSTGEGDIEHLHRAGPARGRRIHVRGVPRPRRAPRDRSPRAPPHHKPDAGVGRCRLHPPPPGVLRHARRRRPRSGARDRRRGAGGRGTAAVDRRGRGRDLLRRDHHFCPRCRRPRGLRGRRPTRPANGADALPEAAACAVARS